MIMLWVQNRKIHRGKFTVKKKILVMGGFQFCPSSLSSKASLLEIIADSCHLYCVLLWLFRGISNKSFAECSLPFDLILQTFCQC